MILTPYQKDGLTELVNISFSRAVASLAELTGHRIGLTVPQVDVYPIGELGHALSGYVVGEVTTVHQLFSGKVSGDAFMILDYNGSILLSDLLTEQSRNTDKLNASDREVLTEVGNILLNACLGTMGNVLKVHISFSVPKIHLDSLDSLIKSLIIGKDELRYAIVVTMMFNIHESSIQGYLMIVLGVTSLDYLLETIEKSDSVEVV